MLPVLFGVVVAVLVRTFRPGSRATRQLAATAIFRHETWPAEAKLAGLELPAKEG